MSPEWDDGYIDREDDSVIWYDGLYPWEEEELYGMPKPGEFGCFHSSLMSRWLSDLIKWKLEQTYFVKLFAGDYGELEVLVSVGGSSVRLSLADVKKGRVLQMEVVRYGELAKCLQAYGVPGDYVYLEENTREPLASWFVEVLFPSDGVEIHREGRVISVKTVAREIYTPPSPPEDPIIVDIPDMIDGVEEWI